MRTSNIIPTRNFANPSHAIIVAGAILQEAIPHVGNLSSNWILLKWDLSLIKQIYGLIHKFSRWNNLFSTTPCLSSSCVYKILVHIFFCFDPNYRTVGWHPFKCCLLSRFWIWHIFVTIVITAIYYPFSKNTIQKKPVVLRGQLAWL